MVRSDNLHPSNEEIEISFNSINKITQTKSIPTKLKITRKLIFSSNLSLKNLLQYN